jgi:chromosome segregation ATPase
MTDPRREDHVVGLELELVELVEKRERARVQGLSQELATLDAEIEALQAELAAAAEELAEAEEAESLAVVLAPTAGEKTGAWTGDVRRERHPRRNRLRPRGRTAGLTPA